MNFKFISFLCRACSHKLRSLSRAVCAVKRPEQKLKKRGEEIAFVAFLTQKINNNPFWNDALVEWVRNPR